MDILFLMYVGFLFLIIIIIIIIQPSHLARTRSLSIMHEKTSEGADF